MNMIRSLAEASTVINIEAAILAAAAALAAGIILIIIRHRRV